MPLVTNTRYTAETAADCLTAQVLHNYFAHACYRVGLLSHARPVDAEQVAEVAANGVTGFLQGRHDEGAHARGEHDGDEFDAECSDCWADAAEDAR